MAGTREQEFFLQQRPELMTRINPNSRLLRSLRDLRLITPRQESKLKKSGNRSNQVECVLSFLPKMDKHVYYKFCEALKTAGQGRVVEACLKLPELRSEKLVHIDSDEDVVDGATCNMLEDVPEDRPERHRQVSSRSKIPDLINGGHSTTEPLSLRVPMNSLSIESAVQPPHTESKDFFFLAKEATLSKEAILVGQLIPTVISDRKQGPVELWDLFRGVGRPFHMAFLGIKDGLTMLHQIVCEDRVELLEVLFNLGMWTDLCEVRAKGSVAALKGLTAVEIAQRMGHKRMWQGLTQISRQEESLNKLHCAARAGDEALVERLLEQDSSIVNLSSAGNKTPLYWAATSGNYSIMCKLRKAKADILCRCEAGDTLLTRIVSLNHSHLVHALVTEWGLGVEQPGLNGKTPLYIAAENGHLDTFKALLHAECPLSGSVLTAAAVKGRSQFIQTLIDQYKLPTEWKDTVGRTALLAAAEAGQEASINTLLLRNPDVKVIDKRNRNILHYAMLGGSDVVLRRVIEACKSNNCLTDLLDAQDIYSASEDSCVIRARSEGRPVWHYVLARRSHVYIFQQKAQTGLTDLSQYGSTIRSGVGHSPSQSVLSEIKREQYLDQLKPTAPRDLTPLMLAIMKDQHALVQILLQEKPKLDIRDSHGLTALHLSCMKGGVNLVKSLVQAGSNLDMCDNYGQTPELVARRNNHSVIVKYLDIQMQEKLLKKFVHDELARAHRLLDSRSLEAIQNRHESLDRYTVGVLRELQADINQVLYDLGTAPVSQDTS